MARKAVRDYSEDFVVSTIVLGGLMGVGVGLVVAQLSHNDLLGIGAGLIAGAGTIVFSLLLLY